MPRTITTNVQTEIDSDQTTSIELIELEYWTGAVVNTLRMTTASQDIDADTSGTGAGTNTYLGFGGFIGFGEISESHDLRAAGTELTMDGVDQTIISTILNNWFKGNEIRIYRAWLDPDTGTVIDDGQDGSPMLLFAGFQNENYSIQENWAEDGTSTGTCSVTTRVTSRVTHLKIINELFSSVESHMSYLDRVGNSPAPTQDTFFQNVPAIAQRPIYWGKETPQGYSAPRGGPYGGFPGRPDGYDPYNDPT